MSIGRGWLKVPRGSSKGIFLEKKELKKLLKKCNPREGSGPQVYHYGE